MIFVARQFQEKCLEQRMDLCVANIDLSKVFGTVYTEFLLEIGTCAGCPDIFTEVVRAFYNQMTAIVSIAWKKTALLGVRDLA